MQQFRNKLSRALLITFLCAAPYQSALAAATLDDVVRSVNNASYYIRLKIGELHAYIQSLMEEDANGSQPGMGDVVYRNDMSGSLHEVLREGSEGLTQTFFEGVIGPEIKSDTPTVLASLVAQDSYIDKEKMSARDYRRAKAEARCGYKNFNFESLIGPSSYINDKLKCDEGMSDREKRDEAEYAKHFIEFAAGLSDPPENASLDTFFGDGKPLGNDEDKKRSLGESHAYRKYQAALRAYMAAQSIGVNNLQYLMAQRVPSSAAGNKSALAWDEKIAVTRHDSPDWYAKIRGASPTIVARETLFVLVEIQNELHQLRKEQQRLLATNSVQMLKTLEASKTFLKQDARNVKNEAARLSREDEEE